MKSQQARAFLQDICQTPDDDTPRMIFADWLEEQGDSARAELIRIQCRKAQLPRWHPDHLTLSWREKILLTRHAAQWRAELPQLEGVEWGELVRGFVVEVLVTNPRTLHHQGSAIRAAAPVCRASVSGGEGWDDCPPVPFLSALRLRAVDDLFDNADIILGSPLLSTVTELDLSGSYYVAAEQIAALARSPHLGNLTALILDNCYMGGGNLRLLTEQASFHKLTRLSLRGNRNGYHEDARIRPVDVALLVESPLLDALRSLDLTDNEIDSLALGQLLGSQRLRNLVELNVSANRIDGRGIRKLGDDVSPMRLQSLTLSQNSLGDVGVRALSEASCCAALAELHLDTCEIHAAGVQALARAPWAGRLGRLNLAHNSAGADGLHALAGVLSSSLFALNLRDNDLDAEAVKLLLASPAVEGLLSLDLSENALDAAAVAALASPRLKRLTELLLERSALDANVLKVLAGNLPPGLTRLLLSVNPFGDRGLEALLLGGLPAGLNELSLENCGLPGSCVALLARVNLPGLHWLNLSRNPLHAEGAAALARSPLSAVLVELNLDGCNIGDQGAKALAAGHWPLLERLKLASNGIRAEGLLALAKSSGMPRLREVHCRDNPMPYDTYRKLGQRFRTW